MFFREAPKAPPGAVVSFEVRYTKGRKPFPTLPEAQRFAEEERAGGGWAAIDQVTKLEIEKRR